MTESCAPRTAPGSSIFLPTELRSAQLVLQVIAVYVLPLLYGLLGASAYVLRELAREVREMTFTPASALGYGLRASLGLLAGIAVGLLIAPETSINAGIAEINSSPRRVCRPPRRATSA